MSLFYLFYFVICPLLVISGLSLAGMKLEKREGENFSDLTYVSDELYFILSGCLLKI